MNAKCVIKNAFTLLPNDFQLVGFEFENEFYVDKAMPIGCSVPCATWVTFSTFLEWLVGHEGNPGDTLHYLDDFLFVAKQGRPVTWLIFLGLTINT